MTVFEKFFVLAILTKIEIHQMSMNFVLNRMAKSQKTYSWDK